MRSEPLNKNELLMKSRRVITIANTLFYQRPNALFSDTEGEIFGTFSVECVLKERSDIFCACYQNLSVFYCAAAILSRKEATVQGNVKA